MSVRLLAALAVVLVAGCAATPPAEPPPAPAPSRGAYYKDDGPGDNPPPNLDQIADAEPRAEALHRWANRPYRVFGVDYVPMTALQPFRQRGVASWYGRRFHGQKTSSGEPYDMYGMTAAHPTLPIPSYVRVTHLASQRSVVVRVNDRGPFHAGRIIDLSYAAAHRLGFVAAGSAEVEIETVLAQSPAVAGTYLQVGAFGSRENAETLRERLTRELQELRDAAHVLRVGELWRLQLGPYRTAEEARPVAERIEAQFAIRPLVVSR